MRNLVLFNRLDGRPQAELGSNNDSHLDRKLAAVRF